jgi:hypothetical protein
MLGEFSIYLLDVRIRLTKSLLGAFSGAPAASFGQHIHSHLKQKRRKVGKVPQELTVATRVREDWGKCTPRRTAACKLAVITHTGSLGISPARNPASRLGYGRASADPISAGATIYSDGLVPNAIPKNGGRSAAHHGQCRSCCDGPQY